MPEEQDKYAVVQNLAQGIKQFAESSKTLETQVEAQNQILQGMGKLMLKLCEALRENNAILADLLEADDDEYESKAEDIEKIQDGIKAMLKSLVGKRKFR